MTEQEISELLMKLEWDKVTVILPTGRQVVGILELRPETPIKYYRSASSLEPRFVIRKGTLVGTPGSGDVLLTWARARIQDVRGTTIILDLKPDWPSGTESH
jgi:hypothetical protein